MNERIDQLLVKAGAYFGGEGVDYSNFDPKKFAEMIVQECIDIIATYSVRMSRPGEEYLHPIQEIKEHFGVKS